MGKSGGKGFRPCPDTTAALLRGEGWLGVVMPDIWAPAAADLRPISLKFMKGWHVRYF